MRINTRDYPALKSYQFIIRMFLQISAMSSFVLVMNYAIRFLDENIMGVLGSILIYFTLNLASRWTYYYLALRNSNDFAHNVFMEGLNNLISTNIAYTCNFKLFNIQHTKRRLANMKYVEAIPGLFIKQLKSSHLIKFFYNEPSISNYKMKFHFYDTNSHMMNPDSEENAYTVLIISENDFYQTDKKITDSYSANILYNANGIVSERFNFLRTCSDSHKLDLSTRILYKLYKKSFTLFFSKETNRIIRNINKRIM